MSRKSSERTKRLAQKWNDIQHLLICIDVDELFDMQVGDSQSCEKVVHTADIERRPAAKEVLLWRWLDDMTLIPSLQSLQRGQLHTLLMLLELRLRGVSQSTFLLNGPSDGEGQLIDCENLLHRHCSTAALEKSGQLDPRRRVKPLG